MNSKRSERVGEVERRGIEQNDVNQIVLVQREVEEEASTLISR
jgi:hypothetical protein